MQALEKNTNNNKLIHVDMIIFSSVFSNNANSKESLTDPTDFLKINIYYNNITIEKVQVPPCSFVS